MSSRIVNTKPITKPKIARPTPCFLGCTLVLVLGCVLLLGCQQVLSPTPNLYLEGDADWFADVPSELRQTTVDVLYVTDRVQNQKEGKPTTYGYERSGSLAWGSADVELGNQLTWEELAALSQMRNRRTRCRTRRATSSSVGPRCAWRAAACGWSSPTRTTSF